MNWNTLNERSYVPYSNQPEACIVEAESGCCYPGVRVENISFPLTISAIQAAVGICLSEAEVPHRVYVQNRPGADNTLESYWINEFQLPVVEQADVNALSITPLNLNLSVEMDPDESFNSDKNDVDKIHAELKKLLKKAVTPLSNFAVSALLKTDEGWVRGVNIEVTEWSRGLCAERVALAKAIAYGLPLDSASKICIHTSGGDFSSPCGACRQVMVEHLIDAKVELHHPNNTISSHFMNDLLPFNFSANSDLKHHDD